MAFRSRDIISLKDFNGEEIEYIVDKALEIKKALKDEEEAKKFLEKNNKKVDELLKGKRVFTAFTEKSTRTYFSSRIAADLIGAKFIDGFSSAESTSVGKGECWHDTKMMIASYGFDIIVMRHNLDGSAKWASMVAEKYGEKEGSKPLIVNGGDGSNQHPTQCLLDLVSLKEHFGTLKGLKIALLNDLKYGRTGASLMTVAPFFNWEFHLCYPEGFEPREHWMKYLKDNDVRVITHDNIRDAIRGCDMAYQTRPQKERFRDESEFEKVSTEFQINLKLLESIPEDETPVIFHPLPIDMVSFAEISGDLRDHPKNLVYKQAGNGVFARTSGYAIGLGILGSDYEGDNKEIYNPLGELVIEELDFDPKKDAQKYPKTGYIQENGIVIDHIPTNRGRRLSGFLGWEHSDMMLVLAQGVEGGRFGKKDMLKIHCAYDITEEELIKIGLVAPQASVSTIKDGKVLSKIRPVAPEKLEELLKCKNDRCVTHPKHYEFVPHLSYIEQRGDGKEKLLVTRCGYCDTTMTMDDIVLEKRLIYPDEKY